jgi:hypothetical protein
MFAQKMWQKELNLLEYPVKYQLLYMCAMWDV